MPVPMSLPARLFSEVMYTKCNSPTESAENLQTYRFIIHDCPSESTLPLYIRELQLRGVTDVIRACDPTYDKSVFEQNGIRVHDMPFPDGSIPPPKIILQLLELCDARFGPLNRTRRGSQTSNSGSRCSEDSNELTVETKPLRGAIAVHCIAGLGRAPLLVAIALIEAGMSAIDAIQLIRSRRRGAFNSVQLRWLETYRPGKIRPTSSVIDGASKLSMLWNNRIRVGAGVGAVNTAPEKKSKLLFFGKK